MAASGRIAWLDTARAVGIVLVVVGHALRSVERTGLPADTTLMAGVDLSIYSFHMPFFFLLAGMTHAISSKSGIGPVTRSLWWTILMPYLLWSAVWIALKTLFADAANVELRPNQIFWILVEPVDQFWFLYVLFIVRAAWHLIDATGSAVLRRIALVLPLVVGFVGLGRMDGVLTYWLLFWAAFYGLGISLGGEGLMRLGRGTRVIAAVGCAVAWAVLLSMSPDLLDGSFGPARMTIALSGSFALLFAVSLVPASDRPAARLMGFLGEASLAIFLTHTLVGAAARVILGRADLLSAGTLFASATILGLVLPALAYWIVLRLGTALDLPLARWLGFGNARRSAYLPVGAPARRMAAAE